MGHMERAWSALMAGDMDQVVVETQYIDGPNRFLGGIAKLIRAQHGNAANAWMNAANIRLGDRSPCQFLAFDRPETWYVISRMLCRPIDLSGIGYPSEPDKHQS